MEILCSLDFNMKKVGHFYSTKVGHCDSILQKYIHDPVILAYFTLTTQSRSLSLDPTKMHVCPCHSSLLYVGYCDPWQPK